MDIDPNASALPPIAVELRPVALLCDPTAVELPLAVLLDPIAVELDCALLFSPTAVDDSPA
jgi:hypothetical protein